MSIGSVVVAGDLVLESSEETSLGLLPLTMLIDNPFLIFEELSVLNEGLVDIGLARDTSGTLNARRTLNASRSMNMS